MECIYLFYFMFYRYIIIKEQKFVRLSRRTKNCSYVFQGDGNAYSPESWYRDFQECPCILGSTFS